MDSITNTITPILEDIPNGALVINVNGEWSNCPNRAANILQGIEYARYLRRVEKVTRPILFTSFDHQNEILKYPNTSILTAIGHGFVKLPESDAQKQEILNQIKPLNPIQLKDVIINFCELGSAVRDGFHAFKGRLSTIAPQNLSLEEKAELYEHEFKAYETELIRETADYPRVLQEYKRIIQQFDPKNENSVTGILQLGDGVFLKHIPQDENSQSVNETRNIDWKVLFLDDQTNEIAGLLAVLLDRKIECLVAKTVAEAKEIILADKNNEITVVVTDFRLMTERNDWKRPVMQVEQGYDFILWLYKQDRLNAMVALSGLSKWFLMDSFRQVQINVKVYSKSNLQGNGAALFADDLEHYGERVNEAVISTPNAEEWSKLKPFYRWLRLESDDADSIEEYVDHNARYIIYQLDKCLEISGSSDEKLIKSRKKKDNFEGTEQILPKDLQRYKFLQLVDHVGLGSANTPDSFDESHIGTFKLKLVYRRVLIYYHILGTIPMNLVSKVLNLGSATAPVYNKKKLSEDFIYANMKKQFFNKIGLIEEDIPFNILIEEKNWLKNVMGIKIEKARVEISQLYNKVEFFFNAIAPKRYKTLNIPEFDTIFVTGRSTTAMNTDLIALLNHLYGLNNPEFGKFLLELGVAITSIQEAVKPMGTYDKIIQTIDKFYKKTIQ